MKSDTAMWPFNKPKKKSDADKFIEIKGKLIEMVVESWPSFYRDMPFNENVDLAAKVYSYLLTFRQGLKGTSFHQENAPDDVYFLVVLKGIEASGTHTKVELETEFKLKLP